MVKFFHALSAVLFYVLTTSFFIAYLFSFNQIGRGVPLWWMQIADLPLIIAAVTYGASSLYLSMIKDGSKSYPLFLTIALPSVLIIGFLIVFNFWEVLPLPRG